MRLASIAIGIAFGCVSCGGGGRQQVKIGPPPAKMTKGMLTGESCDNGVCKCRTGEGAGGIGVPADTRKRFEIKLESAYDLWVTLPDTTLYKSPETASVCFYVDLSPGKQPMSIRASNKAGVSFAVEVHELGTKTKAWYDTFAFRCGHPGVCSFAERDGKKAEYAGIKRGLHDKCGSTKIKGVAWDHGKSPDNHFIPSGWMGDYGDIKYDDKYMENPHAGTTSVKIVYNNKATQGARWAGIYWQNPPNNWGTRPGGYDLTGAKKLTFWARGDKGGERIEEFKIGGITGEYADSDVAGIGPVVLTTEWQQYTIDLEGKDLSSISGGFCWSTNLDVNPDGATFYLDDIRYE